VQRFFALTGVTALAVANVSKLNESYIYMNLSEAEPTDYSVVEAGQPCSV
jgi:hypothetical protein